MTEPSPPMTRQTTATPTTVSEESTTAAATAASSQQHLAFEHVRRYQTAFDAIVDALTQYEVDREAAIAAKRQAEEDAAIAKAEAERLRKEKEALEEEEKRKLADTEVPVAEQTGGEVLPPQGDGASAAPAPDTAVAAEVKPPPATNSLFSPSNTVTSPTNASSSSPNGKQNAATDKEKEKEKEQNDPHSPSNYTATASKAIVKGLRELFEGCHTAKDAARAAPFAPWVAALLLEHSTVLEDHNVALFAMCFSNSACTFANHIDTVLDGDVLFAFAMAVAKIHRRQKKILHVCFSGMVNLCHVPKLNAAKSIVPSTIVELLAPLHAEAPVVEAWCMACTNLCLRFPPLIKQFCENGAVLVLERLLLLFGDDPKILTRGLTLLAIFTQHTVAAE